MSDRGKTREALNTEAARWVVLLASDSCDDSTRQRFEAWRNTSPAHEVAFEREQFAWERTGRLRALRPADVHLESAGQESGQPRPGLTVRVPGRWRKAAIAAAFVVVAAVASVLWVHLTTEVYATQVGERRSVRLEDGSRLELNTDTRVAVRMTRKTRHLELLQGESLFEVSHDQARPFIVAIGENTVRAVGTAFNIRRSSASAFKVLVTEGVVEARGGVQGQAPAYEVRVTAGATATYGSHGMESHPISPEEQERMLAWRTGAIALAGETLAEAVAEFNRYNARRLVVADPGIAGLRLGGYFDANDVDAFVKVLSTTFDVGADVVGNETLLRGSGAPASP